MTETLKHLLHEQATTIDFAAADLAAITRAGERRVRRRRGGVAVGGLAALAVLGGLGAAALSGGGGGPEVATDPTSGPAVAWARGTVVHDGSRSIDVGVEVAAFVRTSVGFAVLDPDGVVHAVVDGRVHDVGRVDPEHPRLVADEQGSLVGWVGRGGSGAPVLAVHDLATGDRTARDFDRRVAQDRDDVLLHAIDGRTAYWRTPDGITATDLGGPELAGRASRLAVEDAAQRVEVLDVEAGVLAFRKDERVHVGRSEDTAVALDLQFGDVGALSPGGAWYTQDADEPQVLATATGERLDLDTQDYAFATGYGWLDDDTVAVLAGRTTTGPAELLTCVVPAGDCTVVRDGLGTFEELEDGGFQLPVGIGITG